MNSKESDSAKSELEKLLTATSRPEATHHIYGATIQDLVKQLNEYDGLFEVINVRMIVDAQHPPFYVANCIKGDIK